MTKSIPTIQRYMTTGAITIEPEASFEQALSLMKDNQIRHLPVVEGERLVGLISERELALASSFKGVNPAIEPVRSAMVSAVLTVNPDSPLDQVAFEMADDKSGSAVVVQHHKVVGVVTTVDICRALGELLRTRLR